MISPLVGFLRPAPPELKVGAPAPDPLQSSHRSRWGRGEARVQHEPGPEGIDLAEGARAEQDKRRHLLRRRATFYAGPAVTFAQ